MTMKINLLDTVALIEDVPQFNLAAGEVGAVVEILGDGEAFEVEFCNSAGQTYGIHALKASQIVPLHTQGQALRLRDAA